MTIRAVLQEGGAVITVGPFDNIEIDDDGRTIRGRFDNQETRTVIAQLSGGVLMWTNGVWVYVESFSITDS